MDLEHGYLKMDTTFSCESWSDEGIVQVEVVSFSKKYSKRIEIFLVNDFFEVHHLVGLIGFTYILDTFNCCMTLSTTRKEPHLLRKAKQLLQLFSLTIPVRKAFEIFRGKECIVIKTGYQDGGFSKEAGISKEQFSHRRSLLSDSTFALRQLTSSVIIMHRIETVIVIGDTSQGVETVRDMIRDLFVNNESLVPKIESMERNLARKDIEAVRRQIREKEQH